MTLGDAMFMIGGEPLSLRQNLKVLVGRDMFDWFLFLCPAEVALAIEKHTQNGVLYYPFPSQTELRVIRYRLRFRTSGGNQPDPKQREAAELIAGLWRKELGLIDETFLGDGI